ncbi:hypothetical protein LZ32DRAFT_183283 [Colletotrichum eremochloae]|nr:hypothetical protein LZ32DRAFT_183283 [Colletotrichum eremochloae]
MSGRKSRAGWKKSCSALPASTTVWPMLAARCLAHEDIRRFEFASSMFIVSPVGLIFAVSRPHSHSHPACLSVCLLRLGTIPPSLDSLAIKQPFAAAPIPSPPTFRKSRKPRGMRTSLLPPPS